MDLEELVRDSVPNFIDIDVESSTVDDIPVVTGTMVDDGETYTFEIQKDSDLPDDVMPHLVEDAIRSTVGRVIENRLGDRKI